MQILKLAENKKVGWKSEKGYTALNKIGLQFLDDFLSNHYNFDYKLLLKPL